MRMLDGLMSSSRHPGRRRQGRMGRDEVIACAFMAGCCTSSSCQRSGSAPATEPPAPPACSSNADTHPSSGGSCGDEFADFVR